MRTILYRGAEFLETDVENVELFVKQGWFKTEAEAKKALKPVKDANHVCEDRSEEIKTLNDTIATLTSEKEDLVGKVQGFENTLIPARDMQIANLTKELEDTKASLAAADEVLKELFAELKADDLAMFKERFTTVVAAAKELAESKQKEEATPAGDVKE